MKRRSFLKASVGLPTINVVTVRKGALAVWWRNPRGFFVGTVDTFA